MNKKPLQLKDYLLISFICVLFGVFYLFAVYAGGMFTGVLAPFGLGILGVFRCLLWVTLEKRVSFR